MKKTYEVWISLDNSPFGIRSDSYRLRSIHESIEAAEEAVDKLVSKNLDYSTMIRVLIDDSAEKAKE